MKQTLILLLTLALFVVAVAMQAQTPSDDAAPGALHGLLIDATGRGVPHAYITVDGTSLIARSNACGEYDLDGVPAGEQSVSIGFVATDPRHYVVVIPSGIDAELHFSIDGTMLRGAQSPLPVPVAPTVPVAPSQPVDLTHRDTNLVGVTRFAMTGRVLDEAGEGLPGATVMLVGTSYGAATDIGGYYTIQGIPTGSYTARASAIGQKDQEIAVSGTAGDWISLDFTLASGPVDLSAVLVMGTRTRLIDAQKTGKSNEKTRETLLRQSPTTISGGMARNTTVTTSGGGIGIRGGRANEASIRRDGFEVSEPVSNVDEVEEFEMVEAKPITEREGKLSVPMSTPPPLNPPSPLSAVRNAEVLNAGDDAIARVSNDAIDITGPTYRSTTSSPLSTFSIDVDNGSYTNVRGYLTRGEMPPPSVVRIEEMINYVRYDYPQPTGDDPFAFDSETIVSPWNRDNLLVRVALQGREIDAAQAPPSNLVFLVDVSGSMGSSDKLPLLKESFRHLIAALRPQDSVAIVVYAGAAGLVLEPTSGAEKHLIHHALCRLESGGSTAGGAGINLAYDIARKHFIAGGNNRVILATDGDFNVGVSSEKALVELIEEKRKSGVFLSVLGFGTGNYMDAKMEGLADHGNGNYYFIDRIDEGKRVLGSGMSGTIHAIAKDVKLQIRFNPASVAAYRLLGYENRTLAARDFADDTKDAGELGAGHQVTALYEIVPVGAPGSVRIDSSNAGDYRLAEESAVAFTRNDLLQASLRYKRPADSTSGLIEHLIRDERHDVTTASRSTRLAATIAAWGMMLQEKSPSREITYDRLREWIAIEADVDGENYVAELRSLIDAAERASGAVAAE